jgi:hypothetical protein
MPPKELRPKCPYCMGENNDTDYIYTRNCVRDAFSNKPMNHISLISCSRCGFTIGAIDETVKNLMLEIKNKLELLNQK